MGTWQSLKDVPPLDRSGEAAQRLARASGLTPDHARIQKLYLPLYSWLRPKITTHPLVVGLNAPQGAGKTTLTGVLRRVFGEEGIETAVVSIDAFYLKREEQVALARANADNPLLQARGYPGTHDIALGTETLRRLKSLRAGEEMALPAYDKAAHAGRGDRAPHSSWPVVQGPLRLIILEGWMLGFEPCAGLTDPALAVPNSRLEPYSAWTNELDAFIFLEPENAEFVLSWRVEAERKMREARGAGMTDEEVAAYIATFLPAYRAWLPALSRSPLAVEHALRATIRADRLPAE